MNKGFNDLKYIPIFRSRQQEFIVLTEFNFGEHIYPMIEVIKEKDRSNSSKEPDEFYMNIIDTIQARKIFIDLPTYLKETTSTQKEVLSFIRKTIDNVEQRINFFKKLSLKKDKVIPVISSLVLRTGEVSVGVILQQYEALKNHFPYLAFRLYLKSFDRDFETIKNIFDRSKHLIMYDIDQNDITSPIIRKQIKKIDEYHPRVIIKSSVNEDIQNNKLENGEIVSQANNSVVEFYKSNDFDLFGDYVGIKKDALSSGGTISPGFLFYDPYDNLFYGFKGNKKELSEFEDTIIPELLNSAPYKFLDENYKDYTIDNPGIEIIKNIKLGKESGKNQAKFKKIAMLHYLHCIKTSLEKGVPLPVSTSS